MYTYIPLHTPIYIYIPIFIPTYTYIPPIYPIDSLYLIGGLWQVLFPISAIPHTYGGLHVYLLSQTGG